MSKRRTEIRHQTDMDFIAAIALQYRDEREKRKMKVLAEYKYVMAAKQYYEASGFRSSLIYFSRLILNLDKKDKVCV